MPVKGITLKIARKKPGTTSRAKVRSIVAAVYGNLTAQQGASKSKVSGVLVTKTDKKPLASK